MSAITVERFHPGLRQAWDGFVDAAPGAGPYHHTWWMEVVSRCFAHENVSLIATDRHGQIRAVLPLFRVNGLTQRRLVSIPLRDQAGILGDAPGTRALLEEATSLTRSDHCAYLVMKQGAAFSDDVVQQFRLTPYSHWVTTETALPIATGTVKDAALRNVRKAQRCGLAVEIGADAAFATRFHALFRETRRRLGVPTYSHEFFSMLARLPEHVRIVICSKDRRDLAAAVILFSNRKAVYGYAANSMSGRELRAADLVVWSALAWASERGLDVFDFGADSPLQRDLLRFKQKWAGQPRPLHYYYYLHNARRIPAHDSSGAYWKWIRTSISLLPQRAFDAFSRHAVRYVD